MGYDVQDIFQYLSKLYLTNAHLALRIFPVDGLSAIALFLMKSSIIYLFHTFPFLRVCNEN
jgi:hypothetical protein